MSSFSLSNEPCSLEIYDTLKDFKTIKKRTTAEYLTTPLNPYRLGILLQIFENDLMMSKQASPYIGNAQHVHNDALQLSTT